MSLITFDTLPQAVATLTAEVLEIKRLLKQFHNQENHEADRWFDLTEVCAYLPDKPAKPTVYGLVNDKKIPYHKNPGQKKLRFLKSEIDLWLNQGRRKTRSEMEHDAGGYVKIKGRN